MGSDDLYEDAKRRAREIIKEVKSTPNKELVAVISLFLIENQFFKLKSELLENLAKESQKD